MQVVDVNLVLYGKVAVVVGLAVGQPRLHSSAGQPHGVTVRVVVASVGSFAGRRSAELPSPDHKCLIPKPALAEVGLGDCADVWPRVLSGGEAQRASLARALVRDPDLLLLDEPFAALDALTRIKAQQLVADLWHRHGYAVLLVTHDVEEALLLADRVLMMEQGAIAHELTIDLPRPRDIGRDRFAALRRQLLTWLGVATIHDAAAVPA